MQFRTTPTRVDAAVSETPAPLLSCKQWTWNPLGLADGESAVHIDVERLSRRTEDSQMYRHPDAVSASTGASEMHSHTDDLDHAAATTAQGSTATLEPPQRPSRTPPRPASFTASVTVELPAAATAATAAAVAAHGRQWYTPSSAVADSAAQYDAHPAAAPASAGASEMHRHTDDHDRSAVTLAPGSTATPEPPPRPSRTPPRPASSTATVTAEPAVAAAAAVASHSRQWHTPSPAVADSVDQSDASTFRTTTRRAKSSGGELKRAATDDTVTQAEMIPVGWGRRDSGRDNIRGDTASTARGTNRSQAAVEVEPIKPFHKWWTHDLRVRARIKEIPQVDRMERDILIQNLRIAQRWETLTLTELQNSAKTLGCPVQCGISHENLVRDMKNHLWGILTAEKPSPQASGVSSTFPSRATHAREQSSGLSRCWSTNNVLRTAAPDLDNICAREAKPSPTVAKPVSQSGGTSFTHPARVIHAGEQSSGVNISWSTKKVPCTAAPELDNTCSREVQHSPAVTKPVSQSAGASFTHPTSAIYAGAQSSGLNRFRSTTNLPSTAVSDSDNAFAREVMRIRSARDHYAVLGVTPGGQSNLDSMRSRYKELALIIHADKRTDSGVALAGGVQACNDAWWRLTAAHEWANEAFDASMAASSQTRQVRIFRSQTAHPQQPPPQHAAPQRWPSSAATVNCAVKPKEPLGAKRSRPFGWGPLDPLPPPQHPFGYLYIRCCD